MNKIIWNITKGYYRCYQGVMRMVLRFMKYPKQRVITEPGCITRIPEIVREKGLNRVLVVCSRSVRKQGLLKELLDGFEKEHITYAIFDDVHPNTTSHNVEDGYAVYMKNRCEGIIAIGGGSVLDCSKIIGIKVSNPTVSFEKMKHMSAIKKACPCIIAVPTTAGTGSESTVAAVVSIVEKKEKYPIISFGAMPQVVLLDANLTSALPKEITANTGMDALTHAVEAYIGTFGTRYTNKEALLAIKLIFENLVPVYNDGSLQQERQNMLLASNHAANAFTRAYTGYVHTISHALSALYDVGHGKTNAILLPYVLKYYGKSIEKKLAEIARYTGIGSPNDGQEALAKQVIRKIEWINQQMNIPTDIPEIQRKDIGIIVDKAIREANPAYPVPKIMNKQECTHIVETLMIASSRI
ncbi:iron-containing alcohol dehydrogenase [Anaerosporobacter faecicola]|uniref:iron-containing alcohol dehydrogenase n=1 Tax=Anaerosporobacter faecicola TaxID=2718714 RepID=UPI00143BAD62|nr:iron-containing alcohol dehydrogenase [Anaerosporobacter faecicola]